MSLPLTFLDKKLITSALVGPDGATHYTFNSTKGFLGRKVTTINAASGLVGCINWREKTFNINGVQQEWKHIKSRSAGIFSSEREWTWGNKPYKLKYHNSHKELLATPSAGSVAWTVRFTTYDEHLFHKNERAVIYFPHQMQDEVERMFILMAILETDIQRQDEEEAASAAAGG
ncbi:hypothetical protein DFH06DRAFT_1328034 [Mycena polygramma]|nr:hypothetical protein DFH06DRAFT_1328034 [Mycena polygramma]